MMLSREAQLILLLLTWSFRGRVMSSGTAWKKRTFVLMLILCLEYGSMGMIQEAIRDMRGVTQWGAMIQVKGPNPLLHHPTTPRPLIPRAEWYPCRWPLTSHRRTLIEAYLPQLLLRHSWGLLRRCRLLRVTLLLRRRWRPGPRRRHHRLTGRRRRTSTTGVTCVPYWRGWQPRW